MPINTDKVREELSLIPTNGYCTMIMKHYFNYDVANEREISMSRLRRDVPFECVLEIRDVIFDSVSEDTNLF